MTIEQAELSTYGAAPVELYRFQRGVKIWTLTSADQSHDHDGETYDPAPIERSSNNDTQDLSRSELTISLPGDHEIAALYAGYPPGEVLTLTLYARHRTDVDLETAVRWNGQVINCRWREQAALADLICQPLEARLKQSGLTRPFSRTCPFDLYGDGCGLDKDSYRQAGIALTVVDGVSLTAPDAALQADGFYDGGLLTYLTPEGYFDARMITAHVGQALTLIAPMQGLAAGVSVDLYPGCNHGTGDCKTKFNNLARFGGWPFIPTQNPFNGSKVF